MINYLKILIFSFLLIGCNAANIPENKKNAPSESLSIQKITDHVYQHTSFLETESFGKVSCNGMIVFDKNEAIIFDTPPDNKTSLELISWVESNLKCKIKAIIPTHFHSDCLGGLEAFHKHGISSYAKHATIEFARSKNSAIP